MARKPGVYDAITPKLRPLPSEDDAQQAKIDVAKAKITDRDAVKLAESYVQLRKAKDEIAAKASAIEVLVKAHEQLLTESRDAKAPGWGLHGVKDNALRLASGETVRIQKEPYGKVVDKEKFRRWCVENGYESQLQLWPSTMNGLVKERLLAGEEPPDGTEAFSYIKVQFIKAGGE